MARFEGRVVIVTGGAKGIGRGCVDVFWNEGARVALIDLDEETSTQAVEKFVSLRSNSAGFYQCDVGDSSKLQTIIQEIASDFGRIDCLINNAGVHPPATALSDFSVLQMEELLRINFLSTYAASQAAFPKLVESKGTIINVSSMTAALGQHLSTAYSATKAAQVGFTKSLAIEAGHLGVRVNAVLPSNVDTPLMRDWANTLDDPESALQRVSDLQVFRRMASSEEIGRVCLFLATEDSSFITGQAIEVDGGAALDY